MGALCLFVISLQGHNLKLGYVETSDGSQENVAKHWCGFVLVTLTVADEQEDKRFVLDQVDDGLSVGVILRRGVWKDSLGLTGREGRPVLYDCRGRGEFGLDR